MSLIHPHRREDTGLHILVTSTVFLIIWAIHSLAFDIVSGRRAHV